MISDLTLAYSEDLTTALLGIDALYRAESGDMDGLVVLNMSTSHQPMPFSHYRAAATYFADLEQQAAHLPEPDRRCYYRQVCRSTLNLITWRERGLSLPDQIAGFLHVPPVPASDQELDSLRSEMRSLLNTMGYSGDLSAQSAAWEAHNRVAPDEVAGVLNVLLDQAWERTAARIELPAPKSDGMHVLTVSGMPFNARCNYMERRVELNIDPVLTRPALKHLAVHECYSGHYVQFKLRETWYHQGIAAADGLLSVVNTASSCTFEGIADNGLQLLEWFDSDDDRFSALMTHYRAGIGTGAAWRLHALGWTAAQVEEWLRAQTLIGGEGWIANRMRFFAAPQRCALIWSYWHGEASVTPVWQRIVPEKRAVFIRFLYGRMHSTQSVTMFV